VKFHFFHLMPYPDLPLDFQDRYRSVWVDLPVKEIYDPVRGNRVYNEYLDQLEFASTLDFDGICVNEHHSNGYGTMPSPNLMAATLARRTRDTTLIVLGASVALYNPPIRVAEEMAMIDVISGGRLVSGFPVGSVMDTTFCYGANPATLREKYREGVELILRAWTEPKPFAFNGKYTKLRYVNVWPQPIQQPHPPVWVPGGGSVDTWDYCLQNNFVYCYLTYFGYPPARPNIQGFWEAADRLGVEKNPYRAGLLQFVAVADSDAEAEKLYGEAASYFYNKCLYMYPGFTDAPGYTTVNTLRRGLRSQVQAAASQTFARKNLSWREIVDKGFIAAGSPETVADQLSEIIDDSNVGQLMLLCHFGNMDNEAVKYNATRVSEDVIPRLRGKFAEWEDNWWPTGGLVDAAVPAPVVSPSAV
jgi:alkanesulfonate monooxygenase SsuD/methylene tetrahydromethanopterin reductase-like flavin-dependent oxidoreductase (luciferase family)